MYAILAKFVLQVFSSTVMAMKLAGYSKGEILSAITRKIMSSHLFGAMSADELAELVRAIGHQLLF